MAIGLVTVPPVTGSQHYNHLFRHRILLNLSYWQTYVSEHQANVTALDDERDGIIKAISFGLEMDEAWPAAYTLIQKFTHFMERRGYWHIWNQILIQALAVAQRRRELDSETDLSGLLARLLSRQGRFRESITYYRQAIKTARRLGNLFDEARACTNLGYYYIGPGYWHRAKVLCCHALDIFERIDNDHGRAHTENHLGVLYTGQGLWDKARLHLEQACTIWQEMGDPHGLMHGFINLGLLYNEIEQPDESLGWLEKALQQAKLTGEETELGTIYMNIGTAHQLKNESAKAEMYTRRAEAIFQHFSNQKGLALVWTNLGLIFTDQKRWEEAEEYLKMALETCRNLKYEYGEIKTLMGMVEYHIIRGNQQQAVTYLNAIEQLTQPDNWERWYGHLQSLLIKYRHTLMGPQPDRLRKIEFGINQQPPPA